MSGLFRRAFTCGSADGTPIPGSRAREPPGRPMRQSAPPWGHDDPAMALSLCSSPGGPSGTDEPAEPTERGPACASGRARGGGVERRGGPTPGCGADAGVVQSVYVPAVRGVVLVGDVKLGVREASRHDQVRQTADLPSPRPTTRPTARHPPRAPIAPPAAHSPLLRAGAARVKGGPKGHRRRRRGTQRSGVKRSEAE
jgi:hypothetical protein